MNSAMQKLSLIVSTLLAILAVHTAGAAIITTTGVYDENVVTTNTVDSSLTSYDVAQFTTDVATAFTNNMGGVIGFNGFTNNTLLDSIEATFGTSGAKTLNIDFNTTHHIVLGLGSANPISGQSTSPAGSTAFGQGPNNDGDANYDIEFTFGSITGGAPFEAVTSLGLTYIGRNNGGGLTNATQVTITAFFSNETSSSVTTTANNAELERFIGFQAPENASITRLYIDLPSDIGRRVFIDDVGFVTSVVPEPSTYALIGGFATVLLVMLRRRK